MLVQKATAALAAGEAMEYILSDETVDRLGDVIEQKGWQLGNFKKNPIALFGHNSSFVIGRWTNVGVRDGALRGRLELLRSGISARLDEIRAAVEAGVLRAVSVGFRAIKAEDMESGGVRYLKSELVECSLVSIPANPNALAVAKSLHLSADAQALIFGKPADEVSAVTRKLHPGESADTHRTIRNKPMSLSKKIESVEQEIVTLKDQVTDITSAEDLDEEKMATLDELNDQLEAKKKTHEALKRSELALATRSDIVTTTTAAPGATAERRPFATAAKTVKPHEYFLRAATIQLLAHAQRKDPEVIRRQHYGDDESTKVIFDVVTRTAVLPATTSTSGWASQLVQTVNADFMETLNRASVYPGLASRGLRLTFGRNGAISIPSRSATPTIAGSFVLEGAPIPVRKGAFTSTTLTPKKMAVISTFTREIAQHSIPAIEGLIRDAIQEDTSVALDTVLLDATAVSTTRPAGLRNGVAVTTATAGGGFAALVGDIKALTGALITATNGNLRAPVWIMNPAQALSIALTQNAGGDFPFQQEVNGSRLQGYPVIVSPTVTAAMVILVDAADFVSVTDDQPMFDVSDQATLHMEDTSPLAISTTGTPNVVAAPVQSLWQTDTIGLRMIMPMNWTLRRAGVLAWTETVTW